MKMFIENLQENTIGMIILFLGILFCFVVPFYLVDYSGEKLWYVMYLVLIPFNFIILDGMGLFD